MAVYQLDDELWFPDPHDGEKGLVAVGGDLSVDRLLLAYSNGIFPWYSFRDVIRGCSTVNGRNRNYCAWLGPNMIKAYTELHQLGYATSVEVWEPQNDSLDNHGKKLVGGLYGVVSRNAFFGESMFSLVPNASKLALIYLAQTLADSGGLFIDCQFETPHLRSMGGGHITYEKYMEILNKQELC